jgi:hypothetical protein
MNWLEGPMRIIDVQRMAGRDMLVGRGEGRSDLPKFLDATFGAAGGETILWDWSGVRVATASYFAAALVPVLKTLSSSGQDIYFVLCGLKVNCEEELDFVLKAEGLAALVADKVERGQVVSAHAIGKLEPAHAETLGKVMRRAGLTAKDLVNGSRRAGRPKIGTTAWINRLVSLHKLGLVRRKRVGKEFIYAVPYMEVPDGRRLD